jgi:hypothetical protein
MFFYLAIATRNHSCKAEQIFLPCLAITTHKVESSRGEQVLSLSALPCHHHRACFVLVCLAQKTKEKQGKACFVLVYPTLLSPEKTIKEQGKVGSIHVYPTLPNHRQREERQALSLFALPPI